MVTFSTCTCTSIRFIIILCGGADCRMADPSSRPAIIRTCIFGHEESLLMKD
jgi:hypothetical protein